MLEVGFGAVLEVEAWVVLEAEVGVVAVVAEVVVVVRVEVEAEVVVAVGIDVEVVVEVGIEVGIGRRAKMKNLYIRLGPPGTGKTQTAKNDILRATREHAPEYIWVGSHTRAAARVLVERDLPLPERNIGTVHALAYRAIGGCDIAEAHWKEFSGDGAVKSDIDDWAADMPERREDNDSAALSELSLLRSRLVPQNQRPSWIQKFEIKWNEFKNDNDYYDFNDLLDAAYVKSAGPNILFVDEAQDMTPLQWRLVRRWGEESLFFILYGDDDQAIYEWAGASADHLVEPETENVKVLEHSKRVPRAVHAVAERMIRRIAHRQDKAYRPRDYGGTAEHIDAHWRSPEGIIQDVQKYISENEEKTCMVVASCSYQLEPLKSLLRAEGIPFHNPYRIRRGDWNPLRRSVMERLELMRGYDVEAGLTAEQWWSILEHVRADFWVGRGAKSRFNQEVSKSKHKHIQMHELLETVRPQALEWIVDAEFERYRSCLLERAANSLDFPVRVFRKFGGDAQPRVILGTIHSVKGGEADRVYVIPDVSNRAYEAIARGETDPITRLFYVAITRAREDLRICSPAGRHFFEI